MSEASELEQEAEAARARLSQTADQIRARMSPGQLMDEVLKQFRDGDGSMMLTNLKTQARDNPMALALVGSGLAWLMMGSGPSRGSASATTGPAYPDPVYQDRGAAHYEGSLSGLHAEGADMEGDRLEASQSASSSRSAMGEGWQEAKDQAGQMADSLRTGGSDALGSIRQGAAKATGMAQDLGSDVLGGIRHGADRAGQVTHDLRARGGDALGMVRHGAADLGQQARRGFLDVLER